MAKAKKTVKKTPKSTTPAVTMQVQATNKIDMSITKDDLITIYIEEQLASKQALKEEYNKQRKELEKKIDEVESSILKSIILKNAEFFNTHTQVVKEGETIKEFKVHANVRVTIDPQDYPTFSALCEENAKLYNLECELQREINDLTREPKKVKAKILKNLLNASTEGQQLLKLISSSKLSLNP